MCAFFEKSQIDNLRDSMNNFKEKTSSFKCESMQPIGAIPQGGDVTLKLDPNHQNLIIHYNKRTEITLTYMRIASFRLECMESFIDDRNSKIAGRALASGVFGRVGKMAGSALMEMQKKEIRWIGTLVYRDKSGEMQELKFIQKLGPEYYGEEEKYSSAAKFERMVNEIACRMGEGITEL